MGGGKNLGKFRCADCGKRHTVWRTDEGLFQVINGCGVFLHERARDELKGHLGRIWDLIANARPLFDEEDYRVLDARLAEILHSATDGLNVIRTHARPFARNQRALGRRQRRKEKRRAATA